MTQSDFISLLQARPAIKGRTIVEVTAYIERGLRAISSYAPKAEVMRDVPANNDDGVYSVGDAVRRVTNVFVAGTNIPITYEVKEVDDGSRELWLYAIRLPSGVGLLDTTDSFSFHGQFTNLSGAYRPRYGGGSGGYEFFDMQYSTNYAFSDLRDDHHLALELYCEYLGYEDRTVDRANLTDIEDREPSGASTTHRRSQSSRAFTDLMKDKMMEFKREVRRPYWSRTAFGVVERLWADYGRVGGVDVLYLG